jgi:DNA-binding NarL/FixJ family response regulator
MSTEHSGSDRVRVILDNEDGSRVEVATGAPESGRRVRVVICDDHRLFVDALAVVLTSRGYEVVARTLHPEAAVEAMALGDIDICVMDLSFPSGDGLDGTRRILAVSPSTRVVLLTGSAESSVTVPALDAGVRGIARKDDDLDRIVKIIQDVHRGEVVAATGMPKRPWPAAASPRRSTNQGQDLARFLTAREREVLERLVRGESTATLARAMEVSYHTARTHIQNVLAKLGVHSKLEAVAFAVNHSVVAIVADSETAGAALSGLDRRAAQA